MGCCCVGCGDFAIWCENGLKELGGGLPGLFSQVFSEEDFLRAGDQMLYHSFVAIVSEGAPVKVRVSVPLKKRGALIGWRSFVARYTAVLEFRPRGRKSRLARNRPYCSRKQALNSPSAKFNCSHMAYPIRISMLLAVLSCCEISPVEAD